jgi:phage FluMu protein Com
MPAELLKFRCYRCNQLLAVAASRAGTVVACPRCKADLQIPPPEPASKQVEKAARRERAGVGSATASSISLASPSRAGAGESLASAEPSIPGDALSKSNLPEVPGFLTEIAAAIPPEVAELRPEDLRVEAEVFQSIAREPVGPLQPPPASFSAPAAITPPPIPAVESEPEARPDLSSLFVLAAQPVESRPESQSQSPPSLVPTGESQEFVPPIAIEPPSVRAAARAESRRPYEVILPASVVLMWSVFVLVGTALSFIAGLLVGHFLWKMH